MSFKSLLLVSVFTVCSSVSVFAQVRLSADFDNGNIGGWSVVDSGKVVSGFDSVRFVRIAARPATDPANPVDDIIPSSRWYNFRMEGVKDRLVILNINGSEVVRPFYSYDGEEYHRFDASENMRPRTLEKFFACDTVFISYFIPYTYARHCAKVVQWSESPFVCLEEVGRSGGGLPIEMLTITDSSVPDSVKKRIWIHSRMHTSETPSAWYTEAVVEELLSDTSFAETLRRCAIFYVVPETNPDGVLGGYSRSSASGIDIGSNWNRPDSLTAPEILSLKSAMSRLTSDRPFDVVLDLHSQKAGRVSYWMHTPESSSTDMYRRKMLLSALTMDHSPYYTPGDELFSTMNPKYVNGWCWGLFGDNTLAVTFETPYTYYNGDAGGEWVTVENIGKLAHSCLLSLSDLLGFSGTSRLFLNIDLPTSVKGWDSVSPAGKLFFGRSYVVASKKRSFLEVAFLSVERGAYDVYKWSVGPLAPTFAKGENCWLRVGEFKQRRTGALRWKYRASDTGDALDALLFVKKDE